VSQKIRRLYLTIIGIIGDSTKRSKKKNRREERKYEKRIECEKNKEIC
jgi:hypothetical protein